MKKWYIPDGFWHTKSNGVFPSHEAICILNTNQIPVSIFLTLYFEDREKLSDFMIKVLAERTTHIRMDQIKNTYGQTVPQNVPYAIMVECEQAISVQYTRVDTSQSEMSVATTIVAMS
ncbi:MAG: sensory rhodopsin transducer [Brevinema sp.]